MMKKKIKKHYADALYWAMSNQSKGKDYHITRTQEAILRKLIHYDRSNEKITYSNLLISQHTFIGEETIRKTIPQLAKMGYLTTAHHRIFDNGEYKNRRTIYIKWDRIEGILQEVPQSTIEKAVELKGKENELDKEIVKGQKSVSQFESDGGKDSKNTVTVPNEIEQVPSYPPILISDEKVKWIQGHKNMGHVEKDMLDRTTQDERRKLFYSENDLWIIDNENMQNLYGIRRFHRGGSMGKLINTLTKGDSIRLNLNDLAYLLDSKGLKFKDLTLEIYKNIKNNGVPKAPRRIS